MAIKLETILKKLTNDLEKNFYQLNENVIYGQQLAKTGSWTYNIQTTEVFWTEEIYIFMGCTFQELDKKLESFLSYVHPDDLEIVRQANNDILKAKEFDIVYRIVTPNGQLKYANEKTKVLYDENNKPFKVVGIIQDITEHKIREYNLKELGEHLNQAQRVAGVGSWEMDIINQKNLCSDETYRIFGIEPKEFDNTYGKMLQYIHPDDVKNIENILEYPPKEPTEIEFRIIRTDGNVRNINEKLEFIFNENGDPIYLYGTIQDITEKKELQKVIEQKQKSINKMQKRFKILIEQSNEVYEIINPDGKIIFISESIEKVLGYKKEEIVGKNIYDFYKGEEAIKLSKMIDMVSNKPDIKAQEDFIFINKAGKELILEVIMRNLLNEPFVQGIVINFRDISKRVSMEQRMAYLTTHDELTGLPNNMYFKKKLKLQCVYANGTNTKFALIRLDINELKNIKISFGYEFCDKLIKCVVQRLKNYLGDIFLSRCAEEQFAIIVNEFETNLGYENIIRDLLDLFKQPFITDKFEINLAVNIGICIYPDNAKNFETMRENLNVALHRAIKEGKNTYKFYSKDLNIQYYKEFTLANDLHKAIDNNQIKIFF